MAKLFNRAKMTTSTTGSGTVTLGSASVGYQSFADAGVSNGDVVQYVIEEGGNFEIGTGTYSSTGTSLTRSPTESSNSGAAISLSGAATVSITAVADDLNRLQHAGSTKVEPSATGATVTGDLAVTGTVDGRDVASDGTKLDGIEAGATADQTAAEIRSLVESASDSNVFTDADHTKLNGIEAGAEVNDPAFKNIAVSGQSTVVADADADTLTLAAGSNVTITTNATTDTVTIASTDTNTTYSAGSGLSLSGTTFTHTDTSTQSSVNNSGRTYIQDITLDGFGHVTGISSATETVTDTARLTTFQLEDGDGTEVTISHGKEVKFVEGGGIDINWTDTSTGSDGDPYDLTFTHADTSSQASVNGSGRTYIQDITLDTYGHVTGLATATETVVNTDTVPNNATITLSAGTGLSGGGNFTTDQSSNETITFNLEAPYTYIDTATGQYGTIKVDDDRGVTWAGYAIRDDWVFMSNGASEAGIYNDTDNDWAIKFAQNGSTSLQYNGSTRFQTESLGASAPVGLRVGSAGNPHNAGALEIAGSSAEKIVLSGNNDPYIRWQEGTTDRFYIQWLAGSNEPLFQNQESGGFQFRSNSTTAAAQIKLLASDGDIYGSVYGTHANEIGFLDQDGNWAYRHARDSLHEWRINNGVEMSLSASTLDMKGNTITEVEDIGLRDRIYHDDDTDTYLSFGTNTITLATGGSSEITVNTTGVRLGDTGNGYFQPVSGNYGSIQIDGGAHGSYEGYSIGGRAVFMHDNNTATGIFNDVSNHWLFLGQFNGYTRMYYNGSHKLETTSTGVTVTGDLNSTSDIRYKKNIETIDSALEKVQSLRGVTFDWDNDAFEEKEDTKKPNFTERATGVIAQDVEKVLPEAVRENEDGFKNVAYGNMVGLLIEAIKEQQEQIDALKKQLNG